MTEKPTSPQNFGFPEPPARRPDRWRGLRVYGWLFVAVVGAVLAWWIYGKTLERHVYYVQIEAQPYETRGEQSEAEKFLPLLRFELVDPEGGPPIQTIENLQGARHTEPVVLRGRALADHAHYGRLRGLLRCTDNEEIWVEPEVRPSVGDTLSFRLSIQQAQDLSMRVIRSHFGVNDLRGRPLSGLEPLFRGTLRENPEGSGRYIIEIEVGDLFDLRLSDIDSLDVPVRHPLSQDDTIILPVSLEWFSDPPPPRRVLEIALSSLVLRHARVVEPGVLELQFNSILDAGTATAEVNYGLWPKEDPSQPIGIEIARLRPEDGTLVELRPASPLRPGTTYVVRVRGLLDDVGAPIDPNRSSVEFVCPTPERPEPKPVLVADLRVFTNPAGARIWLNGQPRSERSNATLRGLAPGEYVVRVEREDHEPAEQHVRMGADETASVAFDLVRVAKGPGRLEMTAHPYADFVVDGTVLATGIGRAALELPSGKHRVEMRHPLFRARLWETVEIRAGETLELQHDFTRQGATGSLRVGRSGGWANIYVDGKDTGKTTPALLEGIPVGERRVTLWRNGRPIAGAEERVVIREGEETEVQFK